MTSTLNALIPKIPFSFFADFWARVTSGARGSVSVEFWGARKLSLGGGGGLARGLYPPPPPPLESPPTPVVPNPRLSCYRLVAL